MDNKWKIINRYIGLEKTEIPIYYSSTPRGHVPLLKTLFSNSCRLNCKYCPFRSERRMERSSWEIDKLVDATLKLYRERRIRGLFLSSSVFSDPDFVVEKELEVVRKLRNRGFKGYIHLRLMPGVSKYLIREAVEYSDRVGLNLESPTPHTFCEIAPDKGDYRVDILKRLKWITDISRGFRNKSVDTQMIYWRNLGNDIDYIKVTQEMYNMGIKRVYYSPFHPIKQTPLETERPESAEKTYRLYQVSFLLRDYGFSMGEIKAILDENGNLPDKDPKLALAEELLDGLIDLKTAGFRELILIPGIGPRTARKIIEMRNEGVLNLYNLRKILGKKRLKKIFNYATI